MLLPILKVSDTRVREEGGNGGDREIGLKSDFGPFLSPGGRIYAFLLSFPISALSYL